MKASNGKFFLAFGSLMVFIMGCASTLSSTSTPVSTDTSVPASAPENTASPAPIPITTPDPPVPTPDTQAAQARAFAEPILQAIANRPLDVEEDFSFDTGNATAEFDNVKYWNLDNVQGLP